MPENVNIGGRYTCEVGDTLNALFNMSPMKDKIKRLGWDPEEVAKSLDADIQVPDWRKFIFPPQVRSQ